MDEIHNGNELYKRVKPALRSKREELNRAGYKTIKDSDIWNLLLQNKWIKERKIALCDIVDDILNTSNEEIFKYFLEDKKYNEVIELPKLKNE